VKGVKWRKRGWKGMGEKRGGRESKGRDGLLFI